MEPGRGSGEGCPGGMTRASWRRVLVLVVTTVQSQLKGTADGTGRTESLPWGEGGGYGGGYGRGRARMCQ